MGETTFKAKLGSRRLGPAPDPGGAPKRPRSSEEEGSEDPFGFDSDVDSRPVTSRGAPQPRAAPSETHQAQRPSEAAETPLSSNQKAAPALAPDWSAQRGLSEEAGGKSWDRCLGHRCSCDPGGCSLLPRTAVKITGLPSFTLTLMQRSGAIGLRFTIKGLFCQTHCSICD